MSRLQEALATYDDHILTEWLLSLWEQGGPKFIQKAIKRPGQLARDFPAQAKGGFSQGELDKIIKTLQTRGAGDKTLSKPDRQKLRRATLAKTLSKF